MPDLSGFIFQIRLCSTRTNTAAKAKTKGNKQSALHQTLIHWSAHIKESESMRVFYKTLFSAHVITAILCWIYIATITIPLLIHSENSGLVDGWALFILAIVTTITVVDILSVVFAQMARGQFLLVISILFSILSALFWGYILFSLISGLLNLYIAGLLQEDIFLSIFSILLALIKLIASVLLFLRNITNPELII